MFNLERTIGPFKRQLPQVRCLLGPKWRVAQKSLTPCVNTNVRKHTFNELKTIINCWSPLSYQPSHMLMSIKEFQNISTGKANTEPIHYSVKVPLVSFLFLLYNMSLLHAKQLRPRPVSAFRTLAIYLSSDNSGSFSWGGNSWKQYSSTWNFPLSSSGSLPQTATIVPTKIVVCIRGQQKGDESYNKGKLDNSKRQTMRVNQYAGRFSMAPFNGHIQSRNCRQHVYSLKSNCFWKYAIDHIKSGGLNI